MARNERQMLLPKARRRLDTGSEVVDIEMHYVIFAVFLREFPQKMLPNVLSHLTHLEVLLEFPDTLKSTGGLY